MKVLVTGGAGFIGSHVVDCLIEKGHTPVILDNMSSGNVQNIRKGVRYYQCALTDTQKLESILKKERVEAICHLAAKTNMRESLTDPFSDIESNIVGLVSLLELVAKKYPIKKFVFSSTGGALYGDTKVLPVTEDAPTNPISPYGVGKLAGERYLYYYHRVHDLPATILRYSNVYGPRNDRKKHIGAVTAFIKKIINGEEVQVFGKGDQTRDFIFVKDLARANVAALARKTNEYLVCNISGGKETSVNTMLRSIEKAVGKKARIVRTPAVRGEVQRSALSNARARKLLKWKPEVSLEKGIADTVQYLLTGEPKQHHERRGKSRH